MKTLDEAKIRIQQDFTDVNPDIDKYAILLRPNSGASNRETPKMIGLIGTADKGHEIVYMLHCDHWNKGYMTEALNAIAGPEGLFWKLPSKFWKYEQLTGSCWDFIPSQQEW